MNEPVVYAIVAMICYGVSDFIYKQAAAAGIRADHFLIAQGWLNIAANSTTASAKALVAHDSIASLWGR